MPSGAIPSLERTMSWNQLLSIIEEAKDIKRQEEQAPLQACPDDGEPLRTGPHNELYCPFCGRRFDE